MLKGDNYSGGSFQGVGGEVEDDVECDEIEVVEEDDDHIILTSRTGRGVSAASHFQHLQEEEDDDHMSSVEHDYDSSLMNEHIAAGNNLFSRQLNDVSGSIFLDEDD
jgi:tRNA U38,U39,U40 pseudouridine synthase TruA